MTHSQLAASLEATAYALLVLDPKGYPLVWNEKFVELFDFRPDSTRRLGQKELEALEQKLTEPGEFVRCVAEIGADPDLVAADMLAFLDGRYIEHHCQPLRVDGLTVGRVLSFRDVTEHEKARHEILDSALRLAGVVGSAMDAIVSTDDQQRIAVFNTAAEQMFGWKAAEVLGRSLNTLIPKRFHEAHVGHIERFGRTSPTSRSAKLRNLLQARRRDGTEFPIEASISHTLVGGRKVFTAIVRDVSERHAAERSLSDSQASLEEGQAIGNLGDWTLDLQTNIVRASRQDLIIFGLDPDVAEVEFSAVLRNVLPEDLPVIDEGLRKVLAQNEPLSIEVRIQRDDGVHWVRITGEAILDDNGVPHRIVGISQDVTQQRHGEQEREKLKLQLLQAQKLEAVGTLAGGIAHDMNNILFAIQGYAEMVLDTLPQDSAAREDQLEVLGAARRAGDLVRQILTFSRRTQVHRVPVRVGSLVKEVCKLLRATLPSSIELRQEISCPDATVLADPVELHQVFMNLATNAMHAIGDKIGELEIGLREIELEPGRSSLPPGHYCLISVSDTGCGIPPENLERIFDPFFTTKEVGKGTGLGLAMIHGIATGLGGGVRVYSEVGQGTTFHVYIPLTQEAAVAVEQVEPRRGSERVLVVDDEPALARLLHKMLVDLGYTVEALNDPLSALELVRSDPSAFDLVLTDETMPGLRGTALAEQLAALRGDLPVVLCTGQGFRSAEPPPSIRRILSKPISRADLSVALRETLEG